MAPAAAFLLLMAGCRPAPPKHAGEAQQPLFRDVAQESGLHFQHFNGAAGDYYMPEALGPGVALLDYDGDGDLDIFVVQGDFLDPGKSAKDSIFSAAAAASHGCRLFRNDLIPSGKLHFTDVTEQAGLHCAGQGMGAAVGDYDNDGWPDLLVTGFGSSILYHNNGNGTFSDVTRSAGVEDHGWTTSATFFDYDRDGRLDLFVTHYVNWIKRKRQCQFKTGEPDYCGPQNFPSAISRLYHNEGNGHFRDVTTESGISALAGPGLGVTAADLNEDGWPDLYVSNDGAASYLWLNKHDGTFREAALESGVALSMDGKAQAGMGITIGDYDNDGHEDIFKTNLTHEGGNLYRNLGNGLFSDFTSQTRLLQKTFPFTGFGTAWLDYDNDGWLDLVVVNGAVYVEESQRGQPFPYLQPNQLFHNEQGRHFTDVSSVAGPDFQVRAVGRGVAIGDLNNDGKVDFVVSSNAGPTRVFLNSGSTANHWLQVQLEGVRCNRLGIGARVAVKRSNGMLLWRRVHTDGSYLSAQDSRVHFGLGTDRMIESLLVAWPNGSSEEWKNIAADQTVRLREGSGTRVRAH
jgi:hypothetical protein